MKIKMLNEATIGKIAAGEVIIRPVSVIKELVENAIDAGATKISVSIENGGKTKMTVLDNGCGIAYNEVILAFERHATSKLLHIEDLQNIETLGFRGEALASIMAVSKVRILTRSEEEETGSQTIFEGGNVINQRVCAHNRGTLIEISDLFYNMPVRQKHMEKAGVEAALIRDMVEKMGLSHPEIAFSFFSNQKKQFTTLGNGELKDTIESIYGRGFFQNLIPLDVENSPMQLKGYIGNLSASRSVRDFQIFFINGRYVKNAALSRAFEEAYEGYMMQHRYPVGIVFIELPGKMLDINIHPAKTEVAVLNQSLVMILFKQGIRQTLRKSDLSVEIFRKAEKNNQLLSICEDRRINLNESEDIDEKHAHAVAESKSQYGEKGYYNQSKREENDCERKTLIKEQKQDKIKGLESKKVDFSTAKIIGQIFSTYILLELGNEAWLIDQHAAHEAFMYEELRSRFELKEKFPAQTLLVPVAISVEPRVVQEFEDWKDELLSYGFECDIFGDDAIMVRSVPVILGEPQGPNLICAFIDTHFYQATADQDIQIRKIISMACKAAVKGNQVLSFDEIRTLLNQLSRLSNPFTCPHGRPIILKIREYDIQKLFKRVV